MRKVKVGIFYMLEMRILTKTLKGFSMVLEFLKRQIEKISSYLWLEKKTISIEDLRSRLLH